MKELKFADNFSLPIDAVTQTFGFIGRRGSGKTYGAGKLAELFLDAGAQIVAVDPIGVWYGLRLSADGHKKGYSIPVFGGAHGDVPLEPESGALIAKLLVEEHFSAILDVSTFRKEQRKRFAADFAEELIHRKKTSRTAVHVFLEESQLFVPQFVGKSDARMVGAFEDLIKLGRNYGIGASLISQRPQAVNKDVLNQTECLLAFQLTGPQERKTIDGWISDKGIDENLKDVLPHLKVGYARLWSPQWLQKSETIHILKKKTFDASSTPEVGAAIVQPRELSPVDVKKISDAMADVVKRAEESDPRKLQARIRQLETELKKASTKPATVEIREVPAFDEKKLEKLQASVDKFYSTIGNSADAVKKFWTDTVDLAEKIELQIMDLRKAIPRHEGAFRLPNRKEFPKPAPNLNQRTIANIQVTPAARHDPTLEGSSIPEGERKILIVAAQYSDRGGATREQLTILAGYKKSTRDAYIKRLSAKGLVEAAPGASVFATAEGIAALGDFEPLPTGRELQTYWLNHLPEGEAKILALLIDSYPNGIERDRLTDATGYKKSTRDAYIKRLAVKKLVKAISGQPVKASDDLFS